MYKLFFSLKCQGEIPAMEKTAPDTAKKTSTATFSKECLEPDLNKDLDDSDCKYTKDTCLLPRFLPRC